MNARTTDGSLRVGSPVATRRRRIRARFRSAGAACAALTIWLSAASCFDRPVEPRRLPSRVAEIRISANVAGTPVSTLVVTVSGADIDPELVFNVATADGRAEATVALPVGLARVVRVRAFSASGTPTHEGSRQIDVQPESNPVISITLIPLLGDQPIDVRFGNLLVQVTPGIGLLAKRQVVTLSALVTDLDGNPVSVNPEDVRWASFDTRVVTVEKDGKATAHAFGEAQVVASYAGAAGAARITVAPAVLAAGDIAECDGEPAIIPPPGAAERETGAILDTLDGLVLALGDNAYDSGTLEEYMCSYEPTWGRHKARTHPVPGNHEYKTPGAAGYYEYFGAAAGDPAKGYYSFDVGEWHVIALNSEIDLGATGEQVTWLKADLAATSKKCVLAFWHRPRFSSGAVHGNSSRVGPFWTALYDAGADLVLVAHEHLYERFAPQTPNAAPDPVRGIRQITSGGGGASLYAFAATLQPNHEFGLSRHGVLQVVLGPTSYSWRFIVRGGTVQDSGMTNCH